MILTVPRKNLQRACATNFIGALWAVDAAWAQSVYRALSLVGFEAAVQMGHPTQQEAAAGAKPEAEREAPLYVMVGDVAVMGIDGPITKHQTSLSAFFGGTSTVALRNAMREAANDSKVKAILLRVSSPGGHVEGTGDAADDIRRVSAMKPVVVFAEDMMASAAYWLGAQGSHLIASPHAAVGSIGVWTQIVDDTEANEKAGIKIHTVKSVPKKAPGIPPVTEADLKEIKKGIDATHEAFVEAIVAGRGEGKVDIDEATTGELFTAKRALALGLIDSLGTIDDALALAQKAAGEGDLRAAIERKKGRAAAVNASLGAKAQGVSPLEEMAAEVERRVAASDASLIDSTQTPPVATDAPSKQSDTLLKGAPPSPEQATAPEPGPEEPDMTKTEAGVDTAAQGGAQSGSPPAPAAPPQKVETPPAATRADLERLKVELREEMKAEANATALKSARDRAAEALPHMSADQIARLVREPADADALIEGIRGARASTSVDLVAQRRKEEEGAGVPNVFQLRQERLKAKGGR